MFLQKAALQRTSVELAVSYMEIYKDEVYDLFVNRESVRYISVKLYCSVTLGPRDSLYPCLHSMLVSGTQTSCP